MDVTILGQGRLGRSLAILLTRAGHQVRAAGRGEALLPSDVVLLTVPDGALTRAAQTVPAGPAVLHCSGATDLGPVAHHTEHGSLHPLMTFPGPEVALPDLRDVPAAIDGTPGALHIAERLALDLGMRAVRVAGDRRLYHAAAVLAGNGATVLIAEACRALEAAGVPADQAAGLLVPLVLQSVKNAVPDPVAALTGPMARRDVQVLQGHRAALDAAGLHDVAALHAQLAASGLAAVSRRRDGS